MFLLRRPLESACGPPVAVVKSDVKLVAPPASDLA
jgi:hypothetical protein